MPLPPPVMAGLRTGQENDAARACSRCPLPSRIVEAGHVARAASEGDRIAATADRRFAHSSGRSRHCRQREMPNAASIVKARCITCAASKDDALSAAGDGGLRGRQEHRAARAAHGIPIAARVEQAHGAARAEVDARSRRR